MNLPFEHQEAPNTTNTPLDGAPQKEESSWIEILRFALIAFVIVMPIRWFIAQPFIVSGASMEDTFHNSDYLIVDRVTYRFTEPSRGDVIIFRYPLEPSKFFIKRIIGLPGDTVVIEGTAVTIKNDSNPEGVTLSEPYINGMHKGSSSTTTLAAGEYFVMGDNRDHSSDSRVWGVLDSEEIIGRAILRLFPFQKISLLPGSFDTEQEFINSNN